MQTKSHVTPERVELQQRIRFNPIRGLDPARLSAMLDAWDAGRIKDAAMMFDKIERRDLTLLSVTQKRYKAPARREYVVTPMDDSKAAARHVEAVEYCLQHVTCSDAIDTDLCEGFSGLVKQMMRAVGHKRVAHEILWKPSRAGLTADLRMVPQWFFERESGGLRFLESESASTGVPLIKGGWMVTTGDGLLEGTSVGYMFKDMSLKDWVTFNEKFGVPGVLGETSAPVGSKEWEAMHTAVRDFANDWAAVVSTGSKISPVEIGGKGSVIPMQDLIEYVDKRMMSVWRGGDLSTQSAGDSVGASVQGEESDILEADDLEMITNTLNKQLLPWIVRYSVGDDRALCEISMPMPDRTDSQQEVATDRFFLDARIPLDANDLYERHGRRKPDEADEVVTSQSDNEHDVTPLANEARLDLVREAVAQSLGVMPDVLSPISDVLEALIDAETSDEDFEALADDVALRMPELIGDIDLRALAKVFEGVSGTATLEGMGADLEKGNTMLPFNKLEQVESPELLKRSQIARRGPGAVTSPKTG